MKREGSSSETTAAAAATTPRPSPREGAVKVSQAMGGRGLVEEGEEDEEGGGGLLGNDYDSDHEEEDKRPPKSTPEPAPESAPPEAPATEPIAPSRIEESAQARDTAAKAEGTEHKATPRAEVLPGTPPLHGAEELPGPPSLPQMKDAPILAPVLRKEEEPAPTREVPPKKEEGASLPAPSTEAAGPQFAKGQR